MLIVKPKKSEKTEFNKSSLLRNETDCYEDDEVGLCFGKDTAGWLESKINPKSFITFSNDGDNYDEFKLRYAFTSLSFNDWVWVGKFMGWIK